MGVLWVGGELRGHLECEATLGIYDRKLAFFGDTEDLIGLSVRVGVRVRVRVGVRVMVRIRVSKKEGISLPKECVEVGNVS